MRNARATTECPWLPQSCADRPKVMLYCHDSYGLGHLRRTLTLAGYLQDHGAATSQLIVTGSPVPQNFSFPEGVDYIKLPSVVKVRNEQYESRGLSIPFTEIREIRSEIALSAARHFRPDVLLVDHAPSGLKGEIVPTLEYLRGIGQARLVLGLRDIVDDSTVVRQAWTRDGIYDLLDRVYDLILVYGEQEIYDVIGEYGLSPFAADKTRYVGYLGRQVAGPSPERIRAALTLQTDRLVVVTAGGGGDGYPLFSAVLDALALEPTPDFDCVLVLGPLMSSGERQRVRQRVPRGVAAVHVLDAVAEMVPFIAAADAVVAMGGYNSVCEILSCGRPAIIVPRVTPRREQCLRAEALRRRGLARMIHPAELSPERLRHELTEILSRPAVASWHLALNGLPRMAAELCAVWRRHASINTSNVHDA